MDAAKGQTLDDYWLKEAAEIYYIDVRPQKDGRHIYTRLNDLVNEVLQCVAQDKLSANAGVAGNDARRRRLLLNSLHEGCVVQNIKKKAAELGVPIRGNSRASWNQAEEKSLPRSRTFGSGERVLGVQRPLAKRTMPGREDAVELSR